nr:hypothetical protein [candidate division Zixibacteria bacterium]
MASQLRILIFAPLFILLILSYGYAQEIVYELPDSLQELQSWEGNGETVILAAGVGCPPAGQIVVTPSSGIAGNSDIYTIDITLPQTGIPYKGGLMFTFPPNFDLSGIVSINIDDNHEGGNLEIYRTFIFGRSIAFTFKAGQSPPPGTVMTFTLNSVGNTPVARQYRLYGIIFNRYLQIVSGPTASQYFDIIPDVPVSLSIRPDQPLWLKAGQSQLFRAIARDRLGNEIRNIEYEWSLTADSDPIGLISGGNLFVTKVGTGRIQAEYMGLTARSGLIAVRPGEINHFEITEYPPYVPSGQVFPSPVVVEVYDAFDNLKTDYDGPAYFTAVDPLAVFYYDAGNPYYFTVADSGVHSFEGSLFQLGAAGYQRLTVTDGFRTGSTGYITVSGEVGPIVSFELEYSSTIMAGKTALISITGAVDENGQPAEGIISLTLLNDGISPGGFEPVINDIYVQHGTGSAVIYLYRAGIAELTAATEQFSRNLNIEVYPGEAAELVMELAESQFVGQPLLGPATLTAMDKFGNIKTDFDASQTPVELNTDRGTLSPSILDNVFDFTDGVADLASEYIIFEGEAGEVRLSAIAGEVLSYPIKITFNNMEFDMAGEVSGYAYIGRDYIINLTVFNNGNLTPEAMTIRAYFKSCPVQCLAIYKPDQMPEPGKFLTFQTAIPTGELLPAEEDSVVIGIESEYFAYSAIITADYIESYRVEPIAPSRLEFVAGSLSCDTLLTPSTLAMLEMRFNLIGSGLPEVAYISNLQLDLEIPQSDPIPLAAETKSVEILDNVMSVRFENVDIPDLKEYGLSDPLSAGLMLSGYIYPAVEPLIYFEQLENFGSVRVEYRSNPEYVSNTLSPLTLLYDTAQSFEFDLVLDGSADILLDPVLSRFELQHQGGILSAFPVDPTKLHPGINRIRTGAIYIPESLVGEELYPGMILNGAELYSRRLDTILFGDETIVVSDQTVVPSWLQIISTDLNTYNPPFVNYNQPFSISVSVENLSDATIDSISIYIQSENGLVTYAEKHGISIPSSSVVGNSFNITAPDYSTPLLIYRSVIEASGAVILSPLDNTVAVSVQSPAEIDLRYALRNTSGSYVDYYQTFSVEAELHNLGEAAAGDGEITLLTGGYDFGVTDSVSEDVETGSTLVFELTAPAQSLSTEFILKVSRMPLDRNTGQPALVNTDSISFPIVVEPGDAELVVDAVAGATSLIREGTTGELLVLKLKNDTENQLNVVELITITIEFTDKNGLHIAPDDILVLAESGFMQDDVLLTSAVIDSGRLVLAFDDYVLDPGISDTISLMAKFRENIPFASFKLYIDRRDIRAIFAAGPRINQLVPIRGESGDSYLISESYVVVKPGLENSLLIRNNPFNPLEGPAEIGYILDADSEVTMTLYTLIGEKVYEISYPAGSEGGRQGQNRVFWDGYNSEGRMVLNGVYVVVIKLAECDETYRLKLAVMK